MWQTLRNAIKHYRTSGAFLLVFLMVGTGVFVNKERIMIPGPTSGVSRSGEPIQGYTSHASFEQDCLHCHAPVHCVTDTRCQDCHMEIAKQREQGEGLHSRLPGTERCQTCHMEHRGRDVMITEFAFMNVDHTALSGFSLALHATDYAGEAMHCNSCHEQQRFITETMDCLTCHAEGDHETTARHIELYGTDCTACHDGKDRYSNFNHDNDYLLDGMHVDVACQDCHKDKVFDGAPKDCASCHEDPALHLGAFGLDCARCHTSSAWSPAYLTGHTFELEHGDQGQVECQTCHTESYQAITCYGCHDHLASDIETSHLEYGYDDIDVCWECHPTGAQGEAEALLENAEQSGGR